MITPGLVSITFRQLSPEKIVALAQRAGLKGIEWGGDVHVPHGDLQRAREVAALTTDAGMTSTAYGSYYRLGEVDPSMFPQVLETALALQTPILRVWAGRRGSAEADAAYREQVTADARRCAEMAAQAGITIACEWHGGTLTDDASSAVQLLESVNQPSFRTYWQPPRQMPLDECLANLDAALPYLVGLHVFHWHPVSGQRLPLAEGATVWKEYLARATHAGNLSALLEFVVEDDPTRLLQDAAVLVEWCRQS